MNIFGPSKNQILILELVDKIQKGHRVLSVKQSRKPILKFRIQIVYSDNRNLAIHQVRTIVKMTGLDYGML